MATRKSRPTTPLYLWIIQHQLQNSRWNEESVGNMTRDYRNYQLNKENGRRSKHDSDHKLLFHVISGTAHGAAPTSTTNTKWPTLRLPHLPPPRNKNFRAINGHIRFRSHLRKFPMHRDVVVKFCVEQKSLISEIWRGSNLGSATNFINF